MTEDINDAVDYLYTHGAKYAHAKAQRVYLEEYRKTLKASLMKEAMVNGAKSAAAAEISAYDDPRYMTLIEGLRDATEQEEQLRWGLVSAQARIEVWRSQQASNRMLDKALS